MMILALGATSLMEVHASIPPRFGIRTSIRTMSGSRSAALSTASAPSPASPTTWMSSSAASTISSPRRKRAWSSTTRTRIGSLRGEPASVLMLTTPSPASSPCSGPKLSAIVPPPEGCGCCAIANPRQRPTGWAGVAMISCPDDSEVTERYAKGSHAGAPGGAQALQGHRLSCHPEGSATRRVSGRGRVRPGDHRVRAQVDDAVVVGVPPVDDTRFLGLGVDEQIEVMPDQLHLVERLVEGHRGGDVGLLADHEGAFTLDLQRADLLRGHAVRLFLVNGLPVAVERRRARNVVGDLGSRESPCAPARVALVVLLAQPGVQLLGRQVECRVRVAGCRFRPDHRTAGAERDLHSVTTVGLSGVRLLGHLDVEADHLAIELLDLLQLQLLGHVLAEPLGHLGLAALDDDVHAELRSRIAPPRCGASPFCTRLR